MNPVQWIYFFYFLWHIHVFYSVLLLYVHLLFIIILSGNAVSIVVLLDPSMRNCFNQLLVTLNISDRFVFQSVIIKKIWNTSNFFLQFSYNFCDIGSTENRFSWILWEDNSSGFLSLPSFSLSRIQVDIDTNSLNTSQYLSIPLYNIIGFTVTSSGYSLAQIWAQKAENVLLSKYVLYAHRNVISLRMKTIKCPHVDGKDRGFWAEQSFSIFDFQDRAVSEYLPDPGSLCWEIHSRLPASPLQRGPGQLQQAALLSPPGPPGCSPRQSHQVPRGP